MNKEKIIEVSRWFIYKLQMSPKKIQKMLYLCYGYYLATYNTDDNNLNDEIFQNNFQAWVHGPVDPDIYNIYRTAGYANLSIEIFENNFDEKTQKVLDYVFDKYGNITADDLESITHLQLPWKEARGKLSSIDPSTKTLSTKTIFNYFKSEGLFINA